MKALLRIFRPLNRDHESSEHWLNGGQFETVKTYEDVHEVSLTAQGLSIDGTTEAIRYTGIYGRGPVMLNADDVVYETLDDEILFNCVDIAD